MATILQISFDNGASMIGFINGYDSVDDVIAADTHELEINGGSFEAIGDRMSYLIDQVQNVLSPQRQARRTQIFRDQGYEPDNYWNIPRKDRDIIDAEVHALYSEPCLIPGESCIELVDAQYTKGFQHCPYGGCPKGSSSSDYIIRNTTTGKQLWINPLTAHLAGSHKLLEKGNDYGITAGDFYIHFMPKSK